MVDRIPRPLLLWSLLGLIALALLAQHVGRAMAGVSGIADLDRVILLYTLLPRAAVAIVAGAALGLSGLLLQQVLRNPLAEPSTLGISAGAQLALAVATIHAPALVEYGREGVALAGGLAAVGLVLAMTWRRGLEPASVVLAGMMIALTATAASAALILANGEYMMSLFIWGGGSLVQQSWGPALTIASRLMIAAAASLLLLRPLALLSLGDAGARGLGLAPGAMRLLVIGIAVGLATTVVSEVGVIAFIGLAAPALAGLSGARTLSKRFMAAPVIGAILLLLTDGLLQSIFAGGGERVPAGAATALLGGPLLLWLLPRLRMFEWPALNALPPLAPRAQRPWMLIAAIFAVAVLLAAAALVLGRGPEGWSVAHGDLLSDLAAWRWPRIGVAAGAGVMIAASGVVIQRVTGNPLASPEILGVGAGAGVGLAVILFAASGAGLVAQTAGASAGAVLALLAILAAGRRGGYGPERLLFAGIAMNALCSAVLTAVIATGNREAFQLLNWISGSTNDVGPEHAVGAFVAAAVLSTPLLAMTRWLGILPLGDATARGLGIPVRAARLILVLLAGLLAAIASLVVGPLSFVGLIAPHLARLIGLGRAQHHLAGSAAIGAALMILSDWLSRMVAFPYQLPLGLFASLIGGPYLIWLLGHGHSRRG